MYAHTAGASLLAVAAAACGGLATGADGGEQREAGSNDGTVTDQLISTHYGGPPPLDAHLDRTLGSDAPETGPVDAMVPDVVPSDAACDAHACPGFIATCCGEPIHCCVAVPPYGAPFPPDSDTPE